MFLVSVLVRGGFDIGGHHCAIVSFIWNIKMGETGGLKFGRAKNNIYKNVPNSYQGIDNLLKENLYT
jgi:hypothetical protein